MDQNHYGGTQENDKREGDDIGKDGESRYRFY